MSRAGDVAYALLRVLTAHVENATRWEVHWTAVANGELRGEKEKNYHRTLTAGSTLPLLTLCKREGFDYADLLEIIPVAFETTNEERGDILRDLRYYVSQHYPDDDIPF